MKGDFSRQSFKKQKHYSSVRMQQGRVQLDADWNEQMDIVDHRLQTEANDFIGVYGAPLNSAGFKISLTPDGKDLQIANGRYYVNGILCEKETATTFTGQPDYPNAKLPDQAGFYLAYLDVWRRHVTAVDDPDIAELALGGADTTTRLQTVAQVKLLSVKKVDEVNKLVEWNALLKDNAGKLSLQVNTPNFTNQLYRIEIHEGGSLSDASFKWSRDNAAVALNITNIKNIRDTDNYTVVVTRTKADEHVRFQNGNWVEISCAEWDLANQPGVMACVQDVNGSILTVGECHQPELLKQLEADNRKKTLRIWNSKDVALKSADGNAYLSLDNGLQIKFENGVFRSGDYWLIATRAIENKVDWPKDNNGQYSSCLPQGIKHYYAPLAFVKWQKDGFLPQSLRDERSFFSPLTNFKSMHAISIAPSTKEGAVVIDENGYVGIGRAEPQAMLDVNGNVNVNGAITFINDAATTTLATAAFGAITPFFICGTGANQIAAPALFKFGGKTLKIEQQGLTLIVIDKAHQIVSYKTFDTADKNPNSPHLRNLANALREMKDRNEVGILLSYATWEWQPAQADAEMLRGVLQAVGLEALLSRADGTKYQRQPYAAIFEKWGGNLDVEKGTRRCKRSEVLQTADADDLYAEITGWLMDGSFVATSSRRN